MNQPSIILLFSLAALDFVHAYSLHLQVPSVVTFQKYEEETCVRINDVRYRESSCIQPLDCLFTINMQPGTYTASEPPRHVDPGYAICTTNFRDVILRTNRSDRIIDSIYLNTSEHSTLHLSAAVSWKQFPGYSGKQRPRVWLEHNGRILGGEKTSDSFHYMDKVPIHPGTHFITIKAKLSEGDDAAWCSCPSIGDGFVVGHRLCGWMTRSQGNSVASLVHKKNSSYYQARAVWVMLPDTNLPSERNYSQITTKWDLSSQEKAGGKMLYHSL